MKKVFLSILTVIYMTVSSGMAMEVHFCMGERTGTDYYTSSSDTCGRCGMKEKKGGCCNDEQKFVKLSDDHKTSPAYHLPELFIAELPASLSYAYGGIILQQITFASQRFSDSGPPIYLRNRVFRI